MSPLRGPHAPAKVFVWAVTLVWVVLLILPRVASLGASATIMQYLLTAVSLGGFCLLSLANPPETLPASGDERDARQALARILSWTWFVWCFTYVVYCADKIVRPSSVPEVASSCVHLLLLEDGVNLVKSVVLALLGIAVVGLRQIRYPATVLGGLSAAVFAVEIVAVLAGRSDSDKVSAVATFGFVVAALCTIAVTLVVTRLQSELFDISWPVRLALLGYPLLEPMYALFHLKRILAAQLAMGRDASVRALSQAIHDCAACASAAPVCDKIENPCVQVRDRIGEVANAVQIWLNVSPLFLFPMKVLLFCALYFHFYSGRAAYAIHVRSRPIGGAKTWFAFRKFDLLDRNTDE